MWRDIGFVFVLTVASLPASVAGRDGRKKPTVWSVQSREKCPQ